ncbi:phage tail protein [Candidatus Poribacteria bacterium]
MRADILLRVILATFLAVAVAGCSDEATDPVGQDDSVKGGIPLTALLAVNAKEETDGPYQNFRFLVEIDGIAQASFSEAVLMDAETEVIEYREGNEPNPATPHKLPGITRYGDLVLRWGVTKSTELHDWFVEFITKGTVKPKGMSVVLLNSEMAEVARWNFKKAWPSKYNAPDFDALGSEIAIEELTIVHEGMHRVS